MGCDYYCIEVPQGWSSDRPEEPMSLPTWVKFPDDGPIPCLCTFPQNWKDQNPDTVPVYSLALLGAAVVLAAHEKLALGETHLVDSIPEWIIEGIKRGVKSEDLNLSRSPRKETE